MFFSPDGCDFFVRMIASNAIKILAGHRTDPNQDAAQPFRKRHA
jgi:hypothetical protein